MLCGYSMGGRLALHVALAAPRRVRRLLLVSTTAGHRGGRGERAARRAADAALADELEIAARSSSSPTAGSRSRCSPTTRAEANAAARSDIVRNDPRALAAALRGIGTGAMEPLWQRLGELDPIEEVVVVSGERDEKFSSIAARLTGAIQGARAVTVPGTGHALPRTAPRALAATISGPSRST